MVFNIKNNVIKETPIIHKNGINKLNCKECNKVYAGEIRYAGWF